LAFLRIGKQVERRVAVARSAEVEQTRQAQASAQIADGQQPEFATA
jgi:hypothetical protein